MVRPQLRSRSFRRVKVKVPSGKTVTRYKRRRPDKATCAKCKAEIAGVPRVRKSYFSNIPKSSKRPNRPYGGNLCPACSRAAVKEKLYINYPGNKE